MLYSVFRWLIVRSSEPPDCMMPLIKRIIHAREPELVLFDVESMARALGGGYGLFLVRVGALFAAIFGMLGLALVARGLYGVVSYTPSDRTHQITALMSLDAAPRHV